MSLPKAKNPQSEELYLISDLFFRALELPPQARDAFVEAQTKNAPHIAVELRNLLSTAEQAKDFLEASVAPRIAWALTSHRLTDSLQPGDKIPGFQIVRELGSGAFATVYLARQTALNREVALKLSRDWIEEARTLAQFEHDNIVKVFSEEVDQEKRQRIICMQYVNGTSLDKLLFHLSQLDSTKVTGRQILSMIDRLALDGNSNRVVSSRERKIFIKMDYYEVILGMGVKIAEALGHAHEKGFLHLDVKPSNILLNRKGRPLLSDFNVAIDHRLLNGDRLPNIGGTAAYMSPEQKAVFRMEDKLTAIAKLDNRSDVYSLGVVLREALAAAKGEEPSHPVEGFFKLLLDRVLERATDSRIEKRFPSAGRLACALQSCLELRGVMQKTPKGGKVSSFMATHPLIAITLVGALPQLIASYIALSYNSMYIVSQLSESQMEVFHSANFYYIPLLYCVGFMVWLYQVGRLRNYLNDPIPYFFEGERLKRLRRHALSLPVWGAFITLFSWMPGSVLIPSLMHLRAGPIASSIFGHFFLSFLLSSLIALSYSYLLHHFLVLRTLYPRLWSGSEEIIKTAKKELNRFEAAVRPCYFLVILAPLVGVSLVLIIGSDVLTKETYRPLRNLSLFLIGVGAFGVFFALELRKRIFELTAAFK